MATELEDIQGLGAKRLQTLHGAGIRNIEDLATSTVEELSEVGLSEKQAKKFITMAKESTAIIETASQRQEVYDNRGHVGTGINLLDDMLGGGWEEETIMAMYGSTGSGKTQLSHYALYTAVSDTGLPAVYIETESNRFRPERLRDFGATEEELDKIHTIAVNDIDTQYNAYGAVIDGFDELSLLIVDSFNSRFRMGGDFDGRQNLTNRSQEMARHISRLEELASTLECPILLVSQIYSEPTQYGTGDRPYGGNIFLHSVLYRLHLKQSTGTLRTVKLENHPAKPEGEIHINIATEDITGSPA